VVNITFLYSFVLGATVPFEYIIPLSRWPQSKLCITTRVIRWVCENFAQKVAQPFFV
jgi:hypothetical protein